MLAPKFDLSDPSIQADPYPTYARLREVARVCRGGPGVFVVTRYADVAALLDDPRLGNHFPEEYYRLSAGDGPARGFLEHIMLHQSGPKHMCLRNVVAQHFDADALHILRGRITKFVNELLGKASDSGFLEAVHDLALPLPAMVVFEIMGIPSYDREEIRPKILDLGKAFTTDAAHENRAVADQAVVWLRGYTSELLRHRRRNPGDDLVSHMMTSGEGTGDSSEEKTIDNIVFLLFAGFETTSSVISTGCAALLDHPHQLERLQNDYSLIPRAIEEFLRYDAPIQSRLRFVHQALEIDGRTIKPGRLVLLLLGSANHDERQFDRPEELDVTRNPNPHLSFGGGDHYCLGAGLARLECKIVFEQLLRRFRKLEPADTSVRGARGPFRSYERIPIRLGAANLKK